MLKIGEHQLKASYNTYTDFLEHTIVVADRFEISFNDATKRILKDEFPYFIQVMEMGGKTMADVFEDAKQTYSWSSRERFYRANGKERTWYTEKLN